MPGDRAKSCQQLTHEMRALPQRSGVEMRAASAKVCAATTQRIAASEGAQSQNYIETATNAAAAAMALGASLTRQTDHPRLLRLALPSEEKKLRRGIRAWRRTRGGPLRR